MMVALLLYAYAIGERSSRRIERRCGEDVAFRVICANRVPDHATIARFQVRHEQPLAATFTQLLALCAKAGVVSVGLVAVDGSLIAGNASRGDAQLSRDPRGGRSDTPDTRLTKRAGGRSVQGYNAQIVTSAEQIILAAELTRAANDSGQLAPVSGEYRVPMHRR